MNNTFYANGIASCITTKMPEFHQILHILFMNSSKSCKMKCIFSCSFVLPFFIAFIVISIIYFYSPICCRYDKLDSGQCDIINNMNFDEDASKKLLKNRYIESNIFPDFLPDTSELIADDEEPIFDFNKHEDEHSESASTASHMTLNSHKHNTAQRLFQHALSFQSPQTSTPNGCGASDEDEDSAMVNADSTLEFSSLYSAALVNRPRTLPVVDELDSQELKRIDKKCADLIKLTQNSSLKRIKKEIYFQHIYHSVAIEGNTMTLAEVRSVVETRVAVLGRSVEEHNEVLGLESALRYINKTLVNKEFLSMYDILAIHKRVLGYNDPIEAGSLRQNQVFVSKHIPPLASDLEFLMKELVKWLQLESVINLHPVKQAALAHHKLVYIHPFTDGNGRTARLLMNLILMRYGYPPVIIRKQDRSLYYNTLQLANQGNLRPFIRFIALSTECTLDVYLHAKEYDVKCFTTLETKNGDAIAL